MPQVPVEVAAAAIACGLGAVLVTKWVVRSLRWSLDPDFCEPPLPVVTPPDREDGATAQGGQSGCKSVGGRDLLPADLYPVTHDHAPGTGHPVHGLVPTVPQALSTLPAGEGNAHG